MRSVHYEMPKSNHTHKSMLLRGVNFGPPVLDRADIEATKGRANHSGRSHGGAPLRGGNNNGRGRGNHTNFLDPRPNPFAAHISQGFVPPGVASNFRETGWAPPLPGSDSFQSGRAPPNSFPYPPPGQGYNYGPPQPPPHNGYYNGPPQPPPNGHFTSIHANQAPNNNYYRPPTGDRYSGYSNRNGR